MYACPYSWLACTKLILVLYVYRYYWLAAKRLAATLAFEFDMNIVGVIFALYVCRYLGSTHKTHSTPDRSLEKQSRRG